jgi:hypothetical protein
MEASKASLTTEAVPSRNSSVSKSAEGARVHSSRGTPTARRMKRGMAIEVSVKVISIDDGRAVRDVRVVVVDDSSLVVPIVSPMVPTPGEPAEGRHCEPKFKTDSRTGQKESRIRIPTREHRHGTAIHRPWIILRDVNDLTRCGLDDNRLSLSGHFLLWVCVQVSRLLCFGASLESPRSRLAAGSHTHRQVPMSRQDSGSYWRALRETA